jgi:GTP cyclohydrolase I
MAHEPANPQVDWNCLMLISKSIEPMQYVNEQDSFGSPVEASVYDMLSQLGVDMSDENVIETPKRVAKAYQNELLVGYRMDPKEIRVTCFGSKNDQMVILRDIEFYSTCSHHLLPFVGKAHIAYIPNGKVVGLSKLARLLECFSRRLQLQERITDQVADALMEHLKPLGAACILEAQHMCMSARGVGKQNAKMVTSAVRGAFREQEATRAEFMTLCQRSA